MKGSEEMRSESGALGVGTQIVKDIVVHCKDLSLYTEGDGRPCKVPSRKGSFLGYVVKRWFWLPRSKIDPRLKGGGIRVI